MAVKGRPGHRGSIGLWMQAIVACILLGRGGMYLMLANFNSKRSQGSKVLLTISTTDGIRDLEVTHYLHREQIFMVGWLSWFACLRVFSRYCQHTTGWLTGVLSTGGWLETLLAEITDKQLLKLQFRLHHSSIRTPHQRLPPPTHSPHSPHVNKPMCRQSMAINPKCHTTVTTFKNSITCEFC